MKNSRAGLDIQRVVRAGSFAEGGLASRNLGDKVMKLIGLIEENEDTEPGVMSDTRRLEAMRTFNEALVNGRVMVDGEGLHPSSQRARVRFSGDKRTIIDGPFAETKELIGG